MSSTGAAGRAAERAARASYVRLLAIIASATHDVALAEDALSDAFEKALRTWPRSGIPDNPEGWLVTVARNRLRDIVGSSAARTNVPLLEGMLHRADHDCVADVVDHEQIPDKRLELLFVCAHPAIDPGIRTPLMLQIVLGFDAAQIAQAFGVETSAMAQRLVRAKKRIRDTGIPFTMPVRTDMPARVDAVLEAVYGAYAIAWLDALPAGEESDLRTSVADEARWLAVLLASLLDTDPEAWGLAALLTFAQSRAPARASFPWPPLDEQDPTQWDSALILEARSLLRRAQALTGLGGAPSRTPSGDPLGRFQLEAAIQAVHCDRARSGELDTAALVTLYRGLVAVAPTAGARAALAEATIRHQQQTRGM